MAYISLINYTLQLQFLQVLTCSWWPSVSSFHVLPLHLSFWLVGTTKLYSSCDPWILIYFETLRSYSKYIHHVPECWLNSNRYILAVDIKIQIIQLIFSLKNPRPCQDLNPQRPWYQADVLPIEPSRLG